MNTLDGSRDDADTNQALATGMAAQGLVQIGLGICIPVLASHEYEQGRRKPENKLGNGGNVVHTGVLGSVFVDELAGRAHLYLGVADWNTGDGWRRWLLACLSTPLFHPSCVLDWLSRRRVVGKSNNSERRAGWMVAS